MANISNIQHLLSPRVYNALLDAGETDLDKIAAQGPLIQQTFGVGRKGFDEIARALAAYESKYGELARPFQHPLVEFGLPVLVAKLLAAAGLSTVEAVIEKGRFVMQEPGIGPNYYAQILEAITAYGEAHE